MTTPAIFGHLRNVASKTTYRSQQYPAIQKTLPKEQQSIINFPAKLIAMPRQQHVRSVVPKATQRRETLGGRISWKHHSVGRYELMGLHKSRNGGTKPIRMTMLVPRAFSWTRESFWMSSLQETALQKGTKSSGPDMTLEARSGAEQRTIPNGQTERKGNDHTSNCDRHVLPFRTYEVSGGLTKEGGCRRRKSPPGKWTSSPDRGPT